MRKWILGGSILVLGVAAIYFVLQDGDDGRKHAQLQPAPVPLPGPDGHAPVPPPARLPMPDDLFAAEPIVLEQPVLAPGDIPLVLPPTLMPIPGVGVALPAGLFNFTTEMPDEIVQALTRTSFHEGVEGSAPFMPPALEEFETVTRRMPYADEEVTAEVWIWMPIHFVPAIGPEILARLAELVQFSSGCEDIAEEVILPPETQMPELIRPDGR